MRVLIAGAATLVIAGASGSAALAQSDAPWTGAYIGGHVGYGFRGDDDDAQTILFDQNLDGVFGDTVTTAATTANTNAFSPGFCNGAANTGTATDGCEQDDDEFTYGARAGYDRQFGDWVVGGIVEVEGTQLQDSVTAFSITPASYVFTRELQTLLAARVRGGYVYDRYLGYVTAGVATGHIENSFRTTNAVNTFSTRDGDTDATGYQLGGGIEARINDRITVGLEYLYTNLDDDDAYTVRAAGPAPANNPFVLRNTAGTDLRRPGQDFDFDEVRVTVAYRF